MSKKKKIITCTCLATALLIIITIVTIVATLSSMATTVLGLEQQRKLSLNATAGQIESFEITGNTSSELTLNFIFESWSIRNIKASISSTSGNLTKTVKVPVLSGSNEAIVYQFLKRAGYTHEGAVGIMGCLWAESGFEPCAIEGENSWTSGKSDLARGYGICQWTNTSAPYRFGRRTNIINWLSQNGYEPYTSSKKLLQGQLKYMLLESGYDEARSFCKSASDVSSATEMWLRRFEGAYTPSYFTVRYSKAKEFEAKYRNYKASSNDEMDAVLKITYQRSGNKVTFTGTLDGIDIAGSFEINSTGKISGTGYYGNGATASGSGNATYVGTSSKQTAAQKRIVRSAKSWTNPYTQGYASLCEAWVCRVYTDAGLSYNGACCASASRDKNSIKTGKIPVGAVIYSGSKYKSSVTCECGRNAGHVAIYIGNGQVAGSQVPFKMSINTWIETFGYGGWSFAGNSIT